MDSSSASPIPGNPVVLSVTGLLSGRDQNSSTESSRLVTMAGLTVKRARCCVQDQAQLPASGARRGRLRTLLGRNIAVIRTKAMNAWGRTSGLVSTRRDGSLSSSVDTGEICQNPERLAAHQEKTNCPPGPSLHGAECRPSDRQPGPAGDVAAQTCPPDAATACTSQTCVTDFRENIPDTDGSGVEASTVSSADTSSAATSTGLAAAEDTQSGAAASADASSTATPTVSAITGDEDGDTTQSGAAASADASSTATPTVSAITGDEDGDTTQSGAVASAGASSTATSTVSAAAEDATVAPVEDATVAPVEDATVAPVEDATVAPVEADAPSTVLTAAGNAQAGTVSSDWCGAVLWRHFKTAMSSVGQLINRLIGNLLALFTCARNTGDNSISGGNPEHSSPVAPSDASGEVNRPARDGASASPQGHIEARGATASGIRDQYLSRACAIATGLMKNPNNPDCRKIPAGLRTGLDGLLSLILQTISFDSIENTLVFHEEISQRFRSSINGCQELLNGWLAKFPESERDSAATYIIIRTLRNRLRNDDQAARTLTRLLPVLSRDQNKNMTQKVRMTFPDLEIKIDCSLNAIKEGIEIGIMLHQSH